MKAIFIQPFHLYVWILIVLSVPVVSLFIWCIAHVKHRTWPERSETSNILESIWYTYGALTAQGNKSRSE